MIVDGNCKIGVNVNSFQIYTDNGNKYDTVYEVYKQYDNRNHVLLTHPKFTFDQVFNNTLKIVYACLELKQLGDVRTYKIANNNIANKLKNIIITNKDLTLLNEQLSSFVHDGSIDVIVTKRKNIVVSSLCTEITLV